MIEYKTPKENQAKPTELSKDINNRNLFLRSLDQECRRLKVLLDIWSPEYIANLPLKVQAYLNSMLNACGQFSKYNHTCRLSQTTIGLLHGDHRKTSNQYIKILALHGYLIKQFRLYKTCIYRMSKNFSISKVKEQLYEILPALKETIYIPFTRNVTQKYLFIYKSSLNNNSIISTCNISSLLSYLNKPKPPPEIENYKTSQKGEVVSQKYCDKQKSCSVVAPTHDEAILWALQGLI